MLANDTIHTWQQKNVVIVVKCERALIWAKKPVSSWDRTQDLSWSSLMPF